MANCRKALIWVLVFGLVYQTKVVSAFNWNTDWARDLYDMAKILYIKPSLVGPPLTGAIFSGPYYYYFFVPVLKFGGENAILLFNAWLFSFAVGVAYLIVPSNVFVMAIGFFPIYWKAARNPGNAFSYLPLLLIWLLVIAKKRILGKWQSFFWGILGGIVVNTHPVNLPLVGLGLLWKRKLSKIAILGLILSCIPLVAFENRHSYPMKAVILSGRFFELMTLIPSSNSPKLGIFRFETHYLTPFIFGVWLIGLTKFRKNSVGKIAILSILIIAISKQIPTYKNSVRSGEMFSKAVNRVVDEKWIEKRSKFNVLGIIGNNAFVPSGNEYRYYFIRRGYFPMDNYHYKNSEKLLIFTEIKDLQVSKLKMWETAEFNLEKSELLNKTVEGRVSIYEYAKK